jgi:glycerol-3-phosphate acyltransferase PlsY
MSLIFRMGIVLTAYAIGSIPTALLYSRLRHHTDIRLLGDGNMGARNIKRMYGFSAGVLVAAMDIFKGMLAVLLTIILDMPLEWRLVAGAAVVLGHDFPVFAGFKGGQGFAVTSGVFLALFPFPALIGFAIYAFLYLLFHNSDIAAGAAMAQLTLHVVLKGGRALEVGFIVLVLLFIPFKKWLDKPRREALKGKKDHAVKPEGEKINTK